MPCNDCSRAENCPPCVNETEPPGSEDSSKDECEGGCVIYTEPPCSPDCICGGKWWRHGCKHSLPPGSTSSSADEQIHKWKRCGCGHPQHASMCRVGDTLDFCHCTKVTSLEDIAARCRDAGGCPRHPAEPEPPGAFVRWKNPQRFTAAEAAEALRPKPVPAEPDEAPACQCGHPPANHDKLRRWRCIGNRNLCGCEVYVPAVPGEHQCCLHHDTEVIADRCCVCDALTPAEPDAAQEAAMDELTALRQEMEATEAECSHESWEERSPNPDFAGETKVSRWCNDCGAYLGRFAPTMPIEEVAMPIGPASVRRPPYAVAYVLADGEQYEVALPGDATVRAHEGALVITHASAVQALTQTRPMEGA